MDYDEIIKRFHIKQGELASRVGLSAESFSNRKQRAIKAKDKHILELIVKYATENEIDLNWLLKGESQKINDNVSYIDSATRILDEVIAETGAENIITEKFKKEIIQLLREELAENEKRTKEKFLRIVAAVGG